MTNSPSSLQILTPADTAAVAEVVRNAAKEGRAVYPCGISPRPLGEGPGVRAESLENCLCLNHLSKGEGNGVVLSLEKMNRLVDHAADDMTVTAEAGMTFAELTKILAAKNQRLPIDVPQPETATLGGLIAVNQAGPRQFGYGTIRDYFLGYTAVDGEGTIYRGGGRVVKNAAGYNMTRLMAGSFGTLSVLTQVTLMVRPLPEMTAVASCDPPEMETAEKLLAGLNKSQVRPVAVELACAGNGKSLSVVLEGPTAEVSWMLETLQTEWTASGIASAKMESAEAAENALRTLADFAADVRIAVWPSQTVEVIKALQEKFPACRVQSHALCGIVLLESSKGNAENIEYYQQLRSLAESFGGKMTVVKCPEILALSREDIWGPKPDGFAVMHAIKERFDPKNILNPGRFIFE
jgi:glycolate oxidase FAD binding subunit